MQDGRGRCRQGSSRPAFTVCSPVRSRSRHRLAERGRDAAVAQSLPTGVSYDEGELLVGQAGHRRPSGDPGSFANWPAFGLADAGYYVLHDNVALFGSDITNPEESTDSTGRPTSRSASLGTAATSSRRSPRRSPQRGPAQQPRKLGRSTSTSRSRSTTSSSPSRRSTSSSYPDGITGGGGAEITGGFTIDTAEQLANELRLGALPINLRLISTQSVSATLGQQALHQGLSPAPSAC